MRIMSLKDRSILEAFLSGSFSSATTTVIYQPLELLKTRIQLHKDSGTQKSSNYLNKLTRLVADITREKSVLYLWRGTGASLLRSVPGVGLYYASLNTLQSSLSNQENKPDSPLQAFCFGLTARSLVSLALIPVTVLKVRYESGLYNYNSLFSAVKDVYFRVGWIGTSSTILRDSLFSGIYYMSYTHLKERSEAQTTSRKNSGLKVRSRGLENFRNGCISGLVASILTNPFDVIKTNIQASKDARLTLLRAFQLVTGGERGYLHLFDGLLLRTLRRTLISATTWTVFECLMANKSVVSSLK